MKRKSILLIVEDSPADARLLREMFSEESLATTELTHVERISEAEQYLAAHTVDMVVLDLGLPDAQGLEGVRRAHAAAPHVPLVVLTGLDDEAMATQALQEGAQDYLLKGQIEPRALLRALRYAVERKNMENALAAQLALATLLSQEIPLGEIARRVMAAVCENLRWEIGALWEFDSKTQRMQCVDQWHDATVSSEVAADLTRSVTFSRGEGLPGAVLESGTAIWVPDLGDPNRFPRAARAERAGIQAAFAFPVIHQGTVIGAMEFFSRRAREMDQALLSAMTLIGSQIGEHMERHKTAQALRESEERYRVVSETAPDAIFTIDAESRILFCNPAVERVFGYAPAEMIGNKLESIIPERFREAHRRGIARYLRTSQRNIPWNGVELTGQHRDGHEFPVEISFGEWTSESGTTFTGFVRDITERKRVDEALRTSEARFRRLLDSDIVGVTFWNLKGGILNANELFLKMVGYNRDDLRSGNLRWKDLTPPEYDAVDARALAEMLATGSCAAFEKEFIKKDGSRVTVLVGSALLEGETYDGSSFVMDITERKKAEATLRLQGAALNAADNAMVITESDGTIAWINPAFTELTGYTADEAIGSNQRDLVRSGVHDSTFYKDMWDTLLAGQTWRGEMTNRHKDGRLYPETQTITPVKDDYDNISHFISVNTDLTAQRHMEAQLRQAQKMEAVGQLAAGVAHEFNNLLQALMSMATIIRLSGATRETSKIGTEMEFQIKRGASITQQLLLFSRRHATEKSGLDLREQVQKAAALLRRLIPENIRIVVENSPQRLPIEGNAGEIQQVLLNLAINARDAMPAGGVLTLRAGFSGDDVFLEVQDTGNGLDEATRARIFEPFFTTKEIGKGSGLGLAVVHGIVEQHLGRIEVQSRAGDGSRFRVLLPAALFQDLPVVESNPGSASDIPIGTAHVLLVEDDEEVRAGVVILLEMIGYQVTSVGSGEEALAIPTELQPDLVLSDVTLPGIGGPALGEHLRQRWPSMKVVLMSGYMEESLRTNAGERGWHFLQKPFEMGELASHLRDALDGKMPGGFLGRTLLPEDISSRASTLVRT